jgi:hypothetical protein
MIALEENFPSGRRTTKATLIFDVLYPSWTMRLEAVQWLQSAETFDESRLREHSEMKYKYLTVRHRLGTLKVSGAFSAHSDPRSRSHLRLLHGE